ncbi:hypothetical protein Tco_0966819 [Tanacetum coccineum]
MNSVHDSGGVSTTDVSGGFSSGFFTRKFTSICPFIDVLGRYVILCSPIMTLHLCNLPATSGREIICLIGWSIITAMGCAWKILAALGQQRTRIGLFRFRCLMEVAFLMHFFKVLNSGKDFSADLERNLFKLANFPLRLWTSLIVRGDESCSTTSVLSGHGFIPSGVIVYPKNIPSTAPNVHFLGLSHRHTLPCSDQPDYQRLCLLSAGTWRQCSLDQKAFLCNNTLLGWCGKPFSLHLTLPSVSDGILCKRLRST